MELECSFDDPDRTLHNDPVDGRVTWRRLHHLGSGAFGTVWKEQCILSDKLQTLDTVRAVKQSPKSQRTSWKRELQAMDKFSQHKEHFVQCSGWFESTQYLYIAMEFIPHGTIQTHISKRPLPEAEAVLIMTQLAQATAYMHQVNFIHRDLKPMNILVNRPGPDWHVKVADFGISKEIIDGIQSTKANVGTLGYQAPEVLLTRSQKYTSAVDIWSLGAIAYCLLTKRPPFLDIPDIVEYAKPNATFPIMAIRKRRCSFFCEDFVQMTMKADRLERLTIDQVLSHAWLAPQSDEDATTGTEGDDPWKASKRWTDSWEVPLRLSDTASPPSHIEPGIDPSTERAFAPPIVHTQVKNASPPLGEPQKNLAGILQKLENTRISVQDFGVPPPRDTFLPMAGSVMLPKSRSSSRKTLKVEIPKYPFSFVDHEGEGNLADDEQLPQIRPEARRAARRRAAAEEASRLAKEAAERVARKKADKRRRQREEERLLLEEDKLRRSRNEARRKVAEEEAARLTNGPANQTGQNRVKNRGRNQGRHAREERQQTMPIYKVKVKRPSTTPEE